MSDKRGEERWTELKLEEKGRPADGGEVRVVTGGDEGCMISFLRKKEV